MFRFFSNLALKSELMNVVDRIPKDLDIWRDKIQKGDVTLRSALEYYHHHVYYMGKVGAYLFVLQELGEYRFVKKYLKKHDLVMQKLNTQWALLEKLCVRYGLDKSAKPYGK